MGGLSSHHVHPYALQSAAFLLSLLFPSAVLALLGGAAVERLRRRGGRRAAQATAAFGATRLASLGD
jgi:hypothetical protein